MNCCRNILRYGCVLMEFLCEDDVYLLVRNDLFIDFVIFLIFDLEVFKWSWSI